MARIFASAHSPEIDDEEIRRIFRLCFSCLQTAQTILNGVIETNSSGAQELIAGTPVPKTIGGNSFLKPCPIYKPVDPETSVETQIVLETTDNSVTATNRVPLIPTGRLLLQQDETHYHLHLFSQKLIAFRKQGNTNPSYLEELKRLLLEYQVLQERRSSLTAQILSFSSTRLMDLNVEILSEQITQIDLNIYKRIQPPELAHGSWLKPERRSKSPNVTASVDFFNYLSSWTQSSVLTPIEPVDRSLAVCQFVKLASCLHRLCSFNALKAILSGLSSVAVSRLSKTYSMLPQKPLTILENLQTLMSEANNYRHFRSILAKRPRPCIPFLGLYLHDLVYADAAQENGLTPAKKLLDSLDAIIFFQSSDYSSLELKLGPQHYILSRPYKSEEVLYQLSLEREPSTRKNPTAEEIFHQRKPISENDELVSPYFKEIWSDIQEPNERNLQSDFIFKISPIDPPSSERNPIRPFDTPELDPEKETQVEDLVRKLHSFRNS